MAQDGQTVPESAASEPLYETPLNEYEVDTAAVNSGYQQLQYLHSAHPKPAIYAYVA